jgi:hypothetical protein
MPERKRPYYQSLRCCPPRRVARPPLGLLERETVLEDLHVYGHFKILCEDLIQDLNAGIGIDRKWELIEQDCTVEKPTPDTILARAR